MSKKISFFINIIVVFLLTFNYLVALELTIIPLEKPVLDKAIKELDYIPTSFEKGLEEFR